MVVHSRAATVARLLPRQDWNDEESESNCIWVEPGPNGNVPITACNAYYNYDPQFAPAVAVAVIFGVLTGIHLFEAVVFKKRYMWVLIMGILWETIAFIIHSLGARDQQQLGYAMAWNLLFLLAPLWINAFAYMTFARMVHYWHPERKIAGLRATAIAKWFVLADILSFIVQGVGGIMASPDASANIIRIGLNIYLAGMGLQQFFIITFLGLMVAFQRRCTRASVEYSAVDEKRSWKPLLFALYGVLVCITVRIIFRLAEFAGGVTPDNPIPFHEEYIYALDCFPMMVASLILVIYHPGRYLVGPDSEFPRLSRKEKKAAKREKKEAKKKAKEQKQEEGQSL
ncbi:Protein RTA1 [Madurella mycetomatis]|uniref:Protein RTA1 n=1 Tax=Madurella mycetomatis TaxID=100816 RepID=A0A175VUS8_9PEZI|nr:Protein RTA1 [Madurella mycetomatis]